MENKIARPERSLKKVARSQEDVDTRGRSKSAIRVLKWSYGAKELSLEPVRQR